MRITPTQRAVLKELSYPQPIGWHVTVLPNRWPPGSAGRRRDGDGNEWVNP